VPLPNGWHPLNGLSEGEQDAIGLIEGMCRMGHVAFALDIEMFSNALLDICECVGGSNGLHLYHQVVQSSENLFYLIWATRKQR
jgi:hypothetical protein